MAQITFKGNPIHTCGTLPPVGSKAPDFCLTGTDLADLSLQHFAGQRMVLNIFPSIDTAVCATSVRRFNAEAARLDNTAILCISLDLPFAHKRFCGAEGLTAVHSVSEMRTRAFGEDYGVRMTDGPLAGLLARAIVVLDSQGTVVYTEQVPEIVEEPNYADALAALNAC